MPSGLPNLSEARHGPRNAALPPVPANSSDDVLRALGQRIRHGGVGAFARLFRAMHAPLCEGVEAYARSRDLAEDIVRDLFLTIWITKEALPWKESPAAISLPQRAIERSIIFGARGESTPCGRVGYGFSHDRGGRGPRFPISGWKRPSSDAGCEARSVRCRLAHRSVFGLAGVPLIARRARDFSRPPRGAWVVRGDPRGAVSVEREDRLRRRTVRRMTVC